MANRIGPKSPRRWFAEPYDEQQRRRVHGNQLSGFTCVNIIYFVHVKQIQLAGMRVFKLVIHYRRVRRVGWWYKCTQRLPAAAGEFPGSKHGMSIHNITTYRTTNKRSSDIATTLQQAYRRLSCSSTHACCYRPVLVANCLTETGITKAS